MTANVALLDSTQLSDVRYKWLVAGHFGDVENSGITKPDPTLPLFRIFIATLPEGVELLLVYDNTNPTTNWKVVQIGELLG